MNEYDKQAQEFLDKTKTAYTSRFMGMQYPPWTNAKEKKRLVPAYSWTLTRNGRTISGQFYGSIDDAEKLFMKNAVDPDQMPQRAVRYQLDDPRGYSEPNSLMRKYDLLSCLTKSDPDTIDNFVSEYGYDLKTSTISEITRTYEAVKKEYQDLISLYNEEEMQLLQEIS